MCVRACVRERVCAFVYLLRVHVRTHTHAHTHTHNTHNPRAASALPPPARSARRTAHLARLAFGAVFLCRPALPLGTAAGSAFCAPPRSLRPSSPANRLWQMTPRTCRPTFLGCAGAGASRGGAVAPMATLDIFDGCGAAVHPHERHVRRDARVGAVHDPGRVLYVALGDWTRSFSELTVSTSAPPQSICMLLMPCLGPA